MAEDSKSGHQRYAQFPQSYDEIVQRTMQLQREINQNAKRKLQFQQKNITDARETELIELKQQYQKITKELFTKKYNNFINNNNEQKRKFYHELICKKEIKKRSVEEIIDVFTTSLTKERQTMMNIINETKKTENVNIYNNVVKSLSQIYIKYLAYCMALIQFG